MTTTITATARHWEGGWELILDEDRATQVRTLDRAVQQVRDYLDTHDEGIDHAHWNIVIDVDLGDDTAEQIDQARRATREAADAQAAAAAKTRDLVRRLRHQGISVTDTAAILGVSRGRVSQLAS